MFTQFISFGLVAISALPLFAAAAPAPQDQSTKCNTGTIHCCDTAQPVNSASGVAGLIPLVVSGLITNTAVTCSPLNVGSVGNGGQCAAQPACCEHTAGGLSCSPLNVNI